MLWLAYVCYDSLRIEYERAYLSYSVREFVRSDALIGCLCGLQDGFMFIRYALQYPGYRNILGRNATHNHAVPDATERENHSLFIA